MHMQLLAAAGPAAAEVYSYTAFANTVDTDLPETSCTASEAPFAMIVLDADSHAGASDVAACSD